MRIVVLGSGYVGLVSGICFAEFGFHVTCIDTNHEKIACLQKGELPIYEPGLQPLLQKNLQSKNIVFANDLDNHLQNADIIFLAVGTPSLPDGAVDLGYITNAVRELAPHLTRYTPIVVKSTVPPNTCKALKQEILTQNPDALFDIISNPEFLREGSAVRDFMQPDRIVIGLDNPKNQDIMARIYRPLQLQNIPIVYTNLATAELIKYASNALLATKIAFINEMADICEKIDADVQILAHGIGLDQRIGPQFLQTGPGFGGSCFPKDTLGLAHFANNVDVPSKIVNAVIVANDERKLACIDKIACACGGEISGFEIAVLGMAFKANTDDIRDSAALEIVPGLLAKGARLRLYDPEALANARQYFGQRENLRYCSTLKECLCNANMVLILTEWDEFKKLSLKDVANLICAYNQMTPKLMVDLRNIYSSDDFYGLNMKYVSLGRPAFQANITTITAGVHEQ